MTTDRSEGTVHRVGVIGASVSDTATPTAVSTSWAVHSHIPAIAALDNVTLTAVATTRKESAERSAALFGAQHAFTSAADLVASADVDLVVVCIRSHGHAIGVEAALQAGKPVWCEWPLGRAGEYERLARLAREHSVTTISGLQGRFAPAVAYAHRLIEEGYVGRVLSAHVYGEYDAFGDNIALGYAAEAESNIHILPNSGGHSFDILTHLVGDVRDVTGTVAYQRNTGYALDWGKQIPMTAPDQFAAQGTLNSGAVFSMHILGGAPHGSPFRINIVGTEGQLVLDTDGVPQFAPITLLGSRGASAPAQLTVPDSYQPVVGPLPTSAVAIANAYSQLPTDLSKGAAPLPDFEHGAKIHRLIDSIAAASRSGMRQTVDD